jgi:flagellar hook-basal body complex protein FliE
MLPIGSPSGISAVSPAALRPSWESSPLRESPGTGAPAGPFTPGPAGAGFGDVLENMVSGVEQRQADAGAITRSVLLGENPNLHQSVIAMQEASIAFSLMVEVRNKVVESYQELMRMPV